MENIFRLIFLLYLFFLIFFLFRIAIQWHNLQTVKVGHYLVEVEECQSWCTSIKRCFNYLFINNYFHLTNHHIDNQVFHHTGSDLIYIVSLWYTGNNSKVEGHKDLQNNNNNDRVSTIKNYRVYWYEYAPVIVHHDIVYIDSDITDRINKLVKTKILIWKKANIREQWDLQIALD
jgi:hypothetical protein